MLILFEVKGDPGADCISLSEIDPEDVETITPLLLRIQENNGWFPTGYFLSSGGIEGNPWDVYIPEFGEIPFKILMDLLPKPMDGFERIVRVLLWQEPPMSLYMI